MSKKKKKKKIIFYILHISKYNKTPFFSFLFNYFTFFTYKSSLIYCFIFLFLFFLFYIIEKILKKI
ncbi:hypothetical protein RhiirA5_182574 [Rhizophagus irregularis]|uniref:Uncharacterized protein n=1 Tax=Rhizophagus irregularis TaxID=588596 RepID=A0A2N0QAR0_9GLOM|nr:hypothetical protein RhiirA5_182574 [Rhizophagus irregularis]